MLVASLARRYGMKATLYNISIYILHLLQTKEYGKMVNFSIVSGVLLGNDLRRPYYKSLRLATSALLVV